MKRALRADMDALRYWKRTISHTAPDTMGGCTPAATAVTVTTVLLGAARPFWPKNIESVDFDGTVYFIFQPAEESEGGAVMPIKDSLFGSFHGRRLWPAQLAGNPCGRSRPVVPGR